MKLQYKKLEVETKIITGDEKNGKWIENFSTLTIEMSSPYMPDKDDLFTFPKLMKKEGMREGTRTGEGGREEERRTTCT